MLLLVSSLIRLRISLVCFLVATALFGAVVVDAGPIATTKSLQRREGPIGDMTIKLAWKYSSGESHGPAASTANPFAMCFFGNLEEYRQVCFEPQFITHKDSTGNPQPETHVAIREFYLPPHIPQGIFLMDLGGHKNDHQNEPIIGHFGPDKSSWTRYFELIQNVAILPLHINDIMEKNHPGYATFELPESDMAYFNMVLFYLTLVKNENGQQVLAPCDTENWVVILKHILQSRELWARILAPNLLCPR
ncbi:hypothetical protein J3R30DRAFT_3694666 [Lentinula aciculospora]|uniref:Uncharacterized protein n=1 Tax=Lentinula aciculospora TaxID=153920 RepID=A0A9W9AX50_9AGAR|nr:hypothetical protein J3R30DRAFT_3698961 [Lentinula aciculospora]KAJ4490848.1 hypothetical protein J3R30DRAFT_3694666 [Lentinula aciculospora]